MPFKEVYPTFVQFKQWAKQLDRKTRKKAKVSFGAFMGASTSRIGFYKTAQPHLLYLLSTKEAERLSLLEGENGRTLFHIWVAQRLTSTS